MFFNRGRLLTTTVIAGLALTAPAFAQSEPETTDNDEATSEEASVAVQDRVVVTGSRIRRSEFTSTQPVQIITSEEVTLEGLVDTSEILQGSTVANTAGQINNYFTGSVLTGGPGVNTLSLRGLGAERTLVLLNGRRAGPAGARGQVGPTDLNVIPSSLIERVEILTDGASSVYGSDAVAGVVNIITRENLEGGQFSAYANQPFESGGEEYNVSLSHGWRFNRGYVSASVDYYERRPLLFGDRDAFACPNDVVFSDEGRTNRADVIDPDTGLFKCTSYGAEMVSLYIANQAGTGYAGAIDFSPDAGAIAGGGPIGCDIDGWRQNRTFFTGFAGCALPGAAPAWFTGSQSEWNDVLRTYFGRSARHSDRYDSRTAVSPVTRTTVNLFAGYDLTPNTEVFGEFMFNRRESSQNSWRQWWGVIDSRHPRNTQFTTVTDPQTGLVYDVWDVEPTLLLNSRAEQTVDYVRFVGGFRGQLDFARGWDWELVYQMSRSEAEYGGNFIYADRIAAATELFTGAHFASGCNTALLTTATACPAGGVDFFSPAVVGNGQLRAEDEAFLLGYETGNTVYEHQYIEGLLAGELFDLPAGPVGAAFGFQIRYESINDQPGEQERSGNYWGSSSAVQTVGSDTIQEVFAEFEIPAIRGVFLIEELTFNVSGRYSDYDSYGSNGTYKIGANWALNSAFRVRSSFGTSFRAPALYELYLGDQTNFGFGQASDPCRNWGLSTNPIIQQNCAIGRPGEGPLPDAFPVQPTSSATVTVGGGLGVLEAETAETFSLGLIWTPSFIDFSAALDYYQVEIENQVGRFSPQGIVNACYTSENFPNDAFCSLFTRAPASHPTRAYEILTINDSYVNIANQTSEGLDLTMRYGHEFSFGDLTLNGRMSYILNWEEQLFPGAAVTQLHDRIGNPRWVARLNARLDRNDWTFFWSTDIVAPVDNNHLYATDTGTYFGETVYFQREVDLYMTHSASVRYAMDQWTLQAGLQNIFDEYPNITSASGGGRVTGWGNVPRTSQYDILGRRAFVNIVRSW
ncbi:TonB-dependent receptor plug [Glycocaulis alkaliphilus]|uniref:TonB-dependent receptor plug n=1 Tax=Glycocaulis alkaliphilus TaxID=1434191 RepID=A0A3T0ED49_9PROT|nr:TonB-dependent receptor [Glycocaulis alkaliphilus]AZU05211.1 TonB-dependent receptor plug [Glycocaulis alkaliphilus]GGB64386.1 TonB-dependent receptor [Glycocaulis alkaliphilus]